MTDIVLILGPVIFQDFEVPARISIGGAQRIALHRLIGGARIIDSLGREDSELRFEGVFSGPDATLRARTLDQLRVSGKPVPVTWDVFYYTAILTKFEADYRSPWWIPFRIVCTVLRDEAESLLATAFSLAESLTSDVTAASTWLTGPDLGTAAALSLVSAPNAAVRGTLDYVAAQASLAASQTAMMQSRNTAETALQGANFSAVGSPAAGVAALGIAVPTAQQLAGTVIAAGYIGRGLVNLANAST